MKILVDALGVDSFESGLAGYSLNILKSLACIENIWLTIICNSRGSKKVLEAVGDGHSLEVIDASVMGIKREKYYLLNARRISKGHDLYHCLSSYLPFFPPPLPLCVTLHDMKYVQCKEFMGGARSWVVKSYIKNTIKRSTHIVAVSLSTKHDAVMYGATPSKCSVIYEGPCISPIEGKVGLRTLNLPEKYLLFVGENRPHKNIRRLIEAFDEVSKVDPSYSLIIAGKDTGKILLSRTNANILLLGPVSNDELYELYERSTLFVFPTLYEGFGLPIIEAMSFGVPVITSFVTSTREVGGEAALFVDPYDVDDLKNKILAILSDDEMYDQRVRISKKYAASFIWSEIALEYRQLYERVVFDEEKMAGVPRKIDSSF